MDETIKIQTTDKKEKEIVKEKENVKGEQPRHRSQRAAKTDASNKITHQQEKGANKKNKEVKETLKKEEAKPVVKVPALP